MLNISWPFLSSLLCGCNSKAKPNLPKSDDKNGQEMFNIVFNWSAIHSEKKDYLENPHFSHSRTGKQKENPKGVDETKL